MVKGGRGNRGDGEGEVLDKPVWGGLKFLKGANKVPNYSWHDHANKKGNGLLVSQWRST